MSTDEQNALAAAKVPDQEGPSSLLDRIRSGAADRGIDLSPLIPCAVLVAVFLLVCLNEPNYLSTNAIQSTLITAAPILLLSIGSALVVLTGALDLSIGGAAALASVLLAKAFPEFGWLGGFLIIMLGAGVVGAVQGWIQAKAQIPSFIVTLGTLSVFTGLALKLSDNQPVIVEEGLGLMNWLYEYTWEIPNTFIAVLISLAVLGALMRWTSLGRTVFASGSAEPAARISGVRTTRVRMFVFAISMMMAALAACCLMAQSATGGPTVGEGLLLPAISAVVVGGTAVSGGVGGLGRAVIGGLIISVVTSGAQITGANPGLQQVLFGLAIIIAAALTTDRFRIGTVK